MIDPGPQTATGNSSVTTERVRATTGGGERPNTCKEKYPQKEEEEAKTTGGAASDSLEE